LGQGEDQLEDKNLPCLVESLEDYEIEKVSCGKSHTLALSRNGVSFAWGLGKKGRLGNGRAESQFKPVLINFNEPIIDVQAGANHSSFITQTSKLYSCGQGSEG